MNNNNNNVVNGRMLLTSKGTLFSVPYKKMESLIEDDKIRMESTMVVDRRTGKKYFRYVVPDDIAKKETEFATVRGRTSRTELWEVLDDDFHPSDVINNAHLGWNLKSRHIQSLRLSLSQ